jgi:hypothetical protein
MENNNIKYPDAVKHQTISFIKSAVRMIGYMLLIWSIPAAMITLLISEIIGIIEELV